MIRKYQSEDKDAVMALIDLNIPEYFDESERHDFEDYLENEREDYFVIEQDGKIVASGGINYFRDEHTARISWDMVHPDHHGKGLGRQLVDHRLAVIKSTPGVRNVIVRTSQLAHNFYAKSGFVLDEVKEDFWAPGFDLYLMSRAVN